jgi:phosphonoacetaldehyde hydrolase
VPTPDGLSSKIVFRAVIWTGISAIVHVKLTAVILDWAGTLVDHGSCAPVAAIQAIFSSAGVPVSSSEARESMGLAKRAHIASLLDQPRVREQWAAIRGRPPESQDVDKLYADFIPRQLEVLKEHAALVHGVAEAAARMRSRGLMIGTTTGYNRAMLQFLLDRAREQGFVPDDAVCPDDVPSGRPNPFMCYLNAVHMQAFPLSSMVKIGDTPVDVEEGLNAGMWTIGITRTGNEVGLSSSEWVSIEEEERVRLLADAQEKLMDAGAHYVAESVAECDDILDRIRRRLELGSRP